MVGVPTDINTKKPEEEERLENCEFDNCDFEKKRIANLSLIKPKKIPTSPGLLDQ